MRITNFHSLSQHLQSVAQEHDTQHAMDIEADFLRELQELESSISKDMAEIEAESIGWIQLSTGTYLHTANVLEPVINIVGIATAVMATDNLLWLV